MGRNREKKIKKDRKQKEKKVLKEKQEKLSVEQEARLKDAARDELLKKAKSLRFDSVPALNMKPKLPTMEAIRKFYVKSQVPKEPFLPVIL